MDSNGEIIASHPVNFNSNELLGASYFFNIKDVDLLKIVVNIRQINKALLQTFHQLQPLETFSENIPIYKYKDKIYTTVDLSGWVTYLRVPFLYYCILYFKGADIGLCKSFAYEKMNDIDTIQNYCNDINSYERNIATAVKKISKYFDKGSGKIDFLLNFDEFKKKIQRKIGVEISLSPNSNGSQYLRTKWTNLKVGNDIEGYIKYKSIVVYYILDDESPGKRTYVEIEYITGMVLAVKEQFGGKPTLTMPFAPHPHIGPGGSICTGNMQNYIDNLWSKKPENWLLFFVGIMNEVITTYNQGGEFAPYISITNLAPKVDKLCSLWSKLSINKNTDTFSLMCDSIKHYNQNTVPDIVREDGIFEEIPIPSSGGLIDMIPTSGSSDSVGRTPIGLTRPDIVLSDDVSNDDATRVNLSINDLLQVGLVQNINVRDTLFSILRNEIQTAGFVHSIESELSNLEFTDFERDDSLVELYTEDQLEALTTQQLYEVANRNIIDDVNDEIVPGQGLYMKNNRAFYYLGTETPASPESFTNFRRVLLDRLLRTVDTDDDIYLPLPVFAIDQEVMQNATLKKLMIHLPDYIIQRAYDISRIEPMYYDEMLGDFIYDRYDNDDSVVVDLRVQALMKYAILHSLNSCAITQHQTYYLKMHITDYTELTQ